MTDTEIHRRRTAVVTGGGGGIGLAIAETLFEQGWHVIAADLRHDAAGPREHVHAHLDVTDERSVEALFGDLDADEPLELLVNCAGIARYGRLEDFTRKDWTDVLAVNLSGAFACTQAAARIMLPRRRGSIVNIVSVAAERGAPGRVSYNVAKAGLVALTKTAAVEWGGRGVRVNAVGPGYVATERVVDAVDSNLIDQDEVLRRVPAGRMARPNEIAEAVAFLASDAAAYITGQTLYVDGGFLADYGVAWKATGPSGPR